MALTTPGSGECRFEMSQEAPAGRPASPERAAARPATPEKSRFATLSAAEYRALNRLTDPVPARPLPGIVSVESPAPHYQAPSAAPVRTTETAYRPTTEQQEAVLDILPDLPEEKPAPAVAEPKNPETIPSVEAHREPPEPPAPQPEQQTMQALSALPREQEPPEQTTMTLR